MSCNAFVHLVQEEKAHHPVIMSANTGGLIGSQLLRGDDAPLYRRGFKVCVGMMSFALAAAIAQHIQYRLTNRRLARKADTESVSSGEEDLASNAVKQFRHTV